MLTKSCPNCTIEFDSHWKEQEIVFCPLHASAPALLTENAELRSALVRAQEEFRRLRDDDLVSPADVKELAGWGEADARAALAAAQETP